MTTPCIEGDLSRQPPCKEDFEGVKIRNEHVLFVLAALALTVLVVAGRHVLLVMRHTQDLDWLQDRVGSMVSQQKSSVLKVPPQGSFLDPRAMSQGYMPAGTATEFRHQLQGAGAVAFGGRR